MYHVATRRSIYCQARKILSSVPWHRAYSVITQPRFEDVQVNVGSSGHVNLRYGPVSLILMLLRVVDTVLNHYRIYNAKPSLSGTSSSEPKPVIIHLSNTSSEPVPRALLDQKSTLVTVSPRWTTENRWPTPLHDLTRAYEWITTHLCTPELVYPQYTTSPTTRPIALVATSKSSSIALSLALSESRPSDEHRISAIALRDGIYDYTILAQQQCPSNADEKTAAFYKDMRSCFDKPANTFDPFVSPKLWFLSAGMHVPTSWPGEEDKAILTSQHNTHVSFGSFEEEDDLSNHEWDSYPTNNGIPSPPSSGKTITSVDLTPPPTKASYLTFQTKGSGIVLPYVRLCVSESAAKSTVRTTSHALKTGKRVKKHKFIEGDWQDFRAEQALEMARLLRRSVSMHEIKDRNGGVDVGGGQDEALDRIDLLGSEGMEEDVDGVWAAEWFRDVI